MPDVARTGMKLSMAETTSATLTPAEKVKQFPTTPGLYLMKDAQGRVHLHRQGQEPAEPGRLVLPQGGRRRPTHLRLDRRGRRRRVPARRQRGRRPPDGGPADQGHPAQVQPRPQGRQVVPLPADHDRRGLPPGQLHPRAARPRRQALRPVPAAPRASAAPSMSSRGSSSSAPARWISRRTIPAGDGSGPACSTRSTSARPRATCGSTASPTAPTSAACSSSSTARRTSLLKEMEEEMRAASKELQFEKAARLRDEIKALKTLNLRGNLAKHAQPEVFYVDPRKGSRASRRSSSSTRSRARSTAWTSPTWAAPRWSARW